MSKIVIFGCGLKNVGKMRDEILYNYYQSVFQLKLSWEGPQNCLGVTGWKASKMICRKNA